jgi:FKBP-type peptidyl-prolyl cis-trans isomerase
MDVEGPPAHAPGLQGNLMVPLRLAYGERGSGRTFGWNATLIFVVELVSIQDQL